MKRSARQGKRNQFYLLAAQAEDAAHRNDMKTLNNLTWQLTGHKGNTNKQVKDWDENILPNHEEQLNRLKENFEELLNGTPVIDPPIIEEWEDLEVKIGSITNEEVRKVINKIKNGKVQ